jgi:dihydrofolate reductase
MGKLVVTEFVSIDGVFEAPGGGEEFEHAGWTFKFDRGEDGTKFKFDELMDADAQLLGRVTYAGFAAAWPRITDEEGFADRMNSMPKYVVSSTLKQADWTNSHIIGLSDVADVKTRHKGDILVAGSGQLVRGLMAEDLVDEFRLMVFPVVLGSGRRLFGEGTPMRSLRFVSSQTVGADGITILTYARPA